MLISHVSIRKGDTGCVVVGGRVSGKPAPQDSFTRWGEGVMGVSVGEMFCCISEQEEVEKLRVERTWYGHHRV